MSVEHCGREWDTPYCGLCGKKLADNTLGIQGLKRHVDARVRSATAKGGNANLPRWESWQKALNDLIENAG